MKKNVVYTFVAMMQQTHSFFKLLGTICFFLLCLPSNGTTQVSLVADNATVAVGQTVNIPLKVTGFNDIFSMQFSINWDSTVLNYKDVHSFSEALPQFGKDGIGTGSVEGGKLIVVWFDNSLTGVNLEDSTAILTLEFEVVGEEGTSSPVAFSNMPVLVEVVDANSSILETTLVDGEVSIPGMSTTTTVLQAQNGMRLFQNHPNPFYRNTTIKTSFESSELVLFTITDALGNLVYKEQFQSNAGENHILVDKSMLPAAGTYNYTVQTSKYQLSKQMIFLP